MTTLTHAEEVALAAKRVAELLSKFGKDQQPANIPNMMPGDSLNIDMKITGADDKMVARIEVRVHFFAKPVDTIVESIKKPA